MCFLFLRNINVSRKSPSQWHIRSCQLQHCICLFVHRFVCLFGCVVCLLVCRSVFLFSVCLIVWLFLLQVSMDQCRCAFCCLGTKVASHNRSPKSGLADCSIASAYMFCNFGTVLTVAVSCYHMQS
jgi:hypothetical protein